MVVTNYLRVPNHRYMADGVQRYVEDGIMPGDFLTAVLENDFKGAVSRADMSNLPLLHDWMIFVVNEMPLQAQGSPEKVRAWAEAGGLNGLIRKAEVAE